MKKSKFTKLISAIGKQVIFDDGNGICLTGKVMGSGPTPDTIMLYDGHHEKVVKRKQVLGKVKKEKWFSMQQIPPEDKMVLLETNNGEVKLGKLLNRQDRDYYELCTHHFHSLYWHKPMPATEFSRWKLVNVPD